MRVKYRDKIWKISTVMNYKSEVRRRIMKNTAKNYDIELPRQYMNVRYRDEWQPWDIAPKAQTDLNSENWKWAIARILTVSYRLEETTEII